MLDNQDLKSFLASNYLINTMRSVFYFKGVTLGLTFYECSSELYPQVNLICKVFFFWLLKFNAI